VGGGIGGVLREKFLSGNPESEPGLRGLMSTVKITPYFPYKILTISLRNEPCSLMTAVTEDAERLRFPELLTKKTLVPYI
jgi:hypothetical protein